MNYRIPEQWKPKSFRNKVAISFFLILIAVLGWHFYLTLGIQQRVAKNSKSTADASGMSVSVNPLTNLLSIKLIVEPLEDEDNPFAALGSALGSAIASAMGPGLIERELNTWARERYDMYAILVPYKVQIVMEEPDPEVAVRMRLEREKRETEEARQKKEEQDRKREIVRSYIASGLTLENVRVSRGESLFGQESHGVFGTIINRGDKTLNEVTVRIYFLDAKGKRIGEKEYHPVLVTELAIGDNSPLRSGYHKDFGYNVEDYAPSNWSKRVDIEIIDIEFANEHP